MSMTDTAHTLITPSSSPTAGCSASETSSRRILLAVTGLSPQVVTETIYALAVRPQGRPSFVPTEVHLITTAEGHERARLALLSPDPGWFYRLRRDYNLPEITFSVDQIHLLVDDSGEPLADIRTPEDNERAADVITEMVRDLTSDPASALHVSIAGGRKTMGYYLGYALSLFGRPQDRLSHVLVGEPFESSWDFFYPTPTSRIITTTRDNKLADCADAQVTLAEIPFVRLRDGQPERLLRGHVRFSEAVAAASRAYAPPRLVLKITDRSAWADGERLDIGQTDFALLVWLAERVAREESEVIWSEPAAAEEFLAVAGRVLNTMGGDFERLEKSLIERKKWPKDLADYFEPHKSRINTAVTEALGPYAAKRYAICRIGRKGESRYYLPLPPEAITIDP